MRPSPIYLPVWDDGKEGTSAPYQPRSKPRASSLIAFSFISIIIGSFLYYQHSILVASYIPRIPFMSAHSQHSAAGWHARSPLHPSGASFVPTREALVSGCLYSTPVDPSGLAAALFKPDVAVDGQGRVLQLSQADFAALEALGRASVADDIPSPGGFRNQWRIKHPRTSRPISWLRTADRDSIKDVSVYGWDKTNLLLERRVGELDRLPDVLHSTFGVFLEGREGLEGGGEVNSRVVEAVAAVVEAD
ncbi:hypothetical protein BOTBODRAFT_31189 [Botryobasidium botryosum FD-172 SS1]|uniref:Uncharacterized protein n=1 Tax=Botryobasidium botryosum (strain FD-172 SS1) TaxID=930990 RepID=A0A067MN19_BOTB1|nr:hypothetical protein BOTBODRAFT_31189 [Botryobasidium botryosum FD-172 SS1]